MLTQSQKLLLPKGRVSKGLSWQATFSKQLDQVLVKRRDLQGVVKVLPSDFESLGIDWERSTKPLIAFSIFSFSFLTWWVTSKRKKTHPHCQPVRTLLIWVRVRRVTINPDLKLEYVSNLLQDRINPVLRERVLQFAKLWRRIRGLLAVLMKLISAHFYQLCQCQLRIIIVTV